MDEKETGRVEAFSDGVFAVAITLLVLNIQPPPINDVDFFKDGKLRDYVLQQWPILLAFVTSFATIGVMWTNHHKVFSRVKYIDNNLLLLNLLLLIVIVFIPYPTALLAEQYKIILKGTTQQFFSPVQTWPWQFALIYSGFMPRIIADFYEKMQTQTIPSRLAVSIS